MQSSLQNALICTCSTGHMIESISTTSDTSDCNQARRNTLHIVFINICIRNILRVRKFWSQMSRMYWILDRQLEDVMFCRFRYRIQALSNVWASYYRTENCFTLYTSKVPSVESTRMWQQKANIGIRRESLITWASAETQIHNKLKRHLMHKPLNTHQRAGKKLELKLRSRPFGDAV